jgi:PDZ domain-containing protein
MSRQTWTAVVSAVCFVACVLVTALVPVPFVVWAPGTTTDLLASGVQTPVGVTGATTYPTSGQLLLPTLSQTGVDARVSLLEALYAYWAPDQEVLPASAVYPAGGDSTTLQRDAAALMDASRANATAAALRTAGIQVSPVPVVSMVNSAGPAVGKLLVGDIVRAVRYTTSATATTVQTAADASAAVASGKVGGQVVFTVERGGARRDVTVVVQGSKSNPDLPVAGVSFAQGYLYAPVITYTLDPTVDDTSGLLLALAAYDKVTPDALLKERIVSGTGSIDANGAVGSVAGVREKIVAAERGGASVFLIPAGNCADVSDLRPSLRLVPVTTLAEAVAALGALSDPAKQQSVKGCS